MLDAPLLDRVRIVLCGTSHPGNIGASARAMKTMGLSSLYLVNPQRFPATEAVAMASNAADLLEHAVVCGSLDEALTGTVFAAACTARSRDLPHAVLTPREAAARLLQESAAGAVALVFGPEKTGLTSGEVSRCGAIAMIPTDPRCASLNLAAAVQVFTYELWQSAQQLPESSPQDAYQAASYEDVEFFFNHLEQTLYDIRFLDPSQPKRLMRRLRRLFQRTRLEKEEVNILRGILTAAQKARSNS